MPAADIRVSELASGIRVVTDHMAHARSVTTGVWVGVGSRDESPSDAGVSHFLEHLFFKGTSTRSARQIAETVDAVGGELNAFTSREHTAFHTRLPASSWRVGIEVLGDLLSDPLLADSDIDAEREVIVEELMAALDTPDDLVHMIAYEAMFGDHPLGREVLGSLESITSMDRDRVVAFFERYYRPATIVVSAAGLVDHDELCAEVERRFDLPAGGEAPSRRAPDYAMEPTVESERDGEQTHVVSLWQGLPLDDDDRYALAVANQIVGGGSASRLFQSIREERSLAYSVYSSSSTYTDSGVVGTYAGTSPSRRDELIEAMDAEIDRVVVEGVTDEELRVAKGYLIGSTELGLEDSGARMARVGRMLTGIGDIISIDDQLARVESVTVADANDVLRRVFGGPRTLSVVGPEPTHPHH